MARRIVALLPPHHCYVEPFAGGLAVLFAKGIPEWAASSAHSYREVVNDRDGDLINMWIALRDDDRLIDTLQHTPYSRQLHALSKGGKTPWAKFVRLSQSFASVEHGSWSINPNAVGCNHSATWLGLIDRLPAVMQRLQGVYIECLDALDVIQRWDRPGTCFYCDPTYPGADQGDYKGYTVDDFRRLIQTIEHAKGSFVLSCYDQPDIEIPSDWQRHEFRASVGASRQLTGKQRHRTEVVWVVDRSNAVQSSQAEITLKR